MATIKKCAVCGAELPAGSLRMLCAKCDSTALVRPGKTRKVVQKTVVLDKEALANRPVPGAAEKSFGDYELLDEIAQGGMGVVYKARQQSLNRVVALKMILWGKFATDDDVKRFLTEAEAASNLDHPNIVPIFEVGEHDGRHYFSMRFIDGGSLADRLEPYLKDQRKSARLMVVIARGVHYAHQRGILHRDLKPANILIDSQGQPHITDFGLAKRVEDDSNLTNTGVIMGSPSYMSPEQATGKTERLTTAADLYSLGAILYLLLTGRPPFQGDSPLDTLKQVLEREPTRPSSINRKIDRDLETICLKCLEKEPQRRYGSAEALADDLVRWLRNEPILARPSNPWERGVKWTKRHPAAAALVVVSLAAIITFSIREADNRTEQRIAADKLKRERDNAMTQERLAKELAEDYRRKDEENRKGLVRFNIGNGARLITPEEGDSTGSLLWFTEALRLEASTGEKMREETCRIRVGAVLQQSPKLIGLFTNEVPFVEAVCSPDKSHLLTFSRNSAHLWDPTSLSPSKTKLKLSNFLGHAALSPDGRLLVAAVSDLNHTACVLDLATGQRIGQPLPHQGTILYTAFSPDGKRVLTTCSDGTARLWDAATSKPVGMILKHKGAIEFAAFSPDGTNVVTTSTDKTARLWDARSGKPAIEQPLQHRDTVTSAAFSPDGRFVVTASKDRSAQIWDAATGAPHGPALQQNGAILHAEFSPDGRRVVTGNSENTARVWNAAYGFVGEPITPPLHHNARVTFARFSPDAHNLLTVAERTVRVWDAETGLPVTPPLLNHDEVLHAMFSPDGRRVIMASRDQTVRIWDITPSQPVSPILPHADAVTQATFSRDGKRVVTVCLDHTAQVWNVADSQPVGPPLRHTNAIQTVAFGRDGQIFTTSGENIRATSSHIWDIATGREEALPGPPGGPGRPGPEFGPGSGPGAGPRTERDRERGKDFAKKLFGKGPPGKMPIVYVVIAPEGRHRLIVFNEEHAEVGARNERVRIPATNITFAVFSQDGRRLVTVNTDPRTKEEIASVWDSSSGKSVGSSTRHSERYTTVALNPDGTHVLVGTNNAARIIEVATGRTLTPPLEHTAELEFAAFSPDGKRVLTTSTDNTARVWDAGTGKPITPFLEHEGRISHATFSPDGRRVLTASWDNTARVWDANTGEGITPPLQHKDRVEYAAFSPDGRRVITASYDHTARIWNLPADDRPVADLAQLAELLSGRQIDAAGSLTPLPLGTVIDAWQTLRAKYTKEFKPPADAQILQRWHEQQAEDCERKKNWFGVIFHLKLLLVDKPEEVALTARLKSAQAELDLASTDQIIVPP
jgi:WD40 repeat protein/tRNA A-37 threonylcarbamoyl transferase component Bud32